MIGDNGVNISAKIGVLLNNQEEMMRLLKQVLASSSVKMLNADIDIVTKPFNDLQLFTSFCNNKIEENDDFKKKVARKVICHIFAVNIITVHCIHINTSNYYKKH
jgi:hypothetical protein